MDIVERLRQQEIVIFDEKGDFQDVPDNLCQEAADEIERLRNLVVALLDNDPDDMAADGVTVLMVWREEARAALKETE